MAVAAVPVRSADGRTLIEPGSGAEVWVARDQGPNRAYDQVGGMVTSPDGSSVYVAASSNGAFAVIAHDATTGDRRWVALTEGPGGIQIYADAVAVSPDGTRLYVSGDAEQSIDTRSTLTIAYDTADGSVLWRARHSVGANRMAIPRRIAVSADGARVFVTGSQTGTHGIDDFWDFFTVGYTAATGAHTWTATYAGPGSGADTAEGIGTSPDGTRVFVVGTSVGSGTLRDFATVAYSAADGSQRWVSRYDAGADDFASGLVVSPYGTRVYVAGFVQTQGSLHGFELVAYRAAGGGQIAAARYDDGGNDMTTDLAISSDGSRVFVTGSGHNDFTTVAFDGSMQGRLWAARYDGGHGVDHASAVALSPDGTRVYVTGSSDEGQVACFGEIGSTAYATVEYDAATGVQGWVSRYGGLKKDPDEAREVAVSPNGSYVFVTGNSDSVCASSDVATVAYQA
jgi:WD40 repeat protein